MASVAIALPTNSMGELTNVGWKAVTPVRASALEARA